MKYRTADDAHEDRGIEFNDAVALCREHGEQYVRSFLISLKKIIDEKLAEFGDAPLEHDMTFDQWADAAFDDALAGDRLAEMVGEVLHARMDDSIDAYAITVACNEFVYYVI